MASEVTEQMRKTPASVKVKTESRPPETDPRLGIPVAPGAAKPGTHRLVTLGDSLTHGFQSGAIYNTEVSYPRIIAWEMGWSESFRYPRYGGPGGLPINIEYLVRRLEGQFGDKLDWWELASAAFSVRSCMDEIEDYWERGAGAQPLKATGINHNLGIYGWDIRDALDRTSGYCAKAIKKPKDDWITQIVEDANDRAALRVLPPLKNDKDPGLSTVDAAEELGKDGGIETLIVFLGANNALGSVLALDAVWSQGGLNRKGLPGPREEAAVHGVGSGAFRRRARRPRHENRGDRGPPRHLGDRTPRHHRSHRQRRRQEGPHRLAVLSLLHAPLDLRLRFRSGG